ncbi:MAG: thioredoxin domain-containing protein, partial [Acidobacteria bacterium]|nr:thioredoxin domain-containing protein [Acidobacteriota bacterium]
MLKLSFAAQLFFAFSFSLILASCATLSAQTISAKPSVDAGRDGHTNRLIHSKSPYLLLHAHNPVDWFPWGDEALEKARRENKPIFLSIGYFTCHWCHVMEKESYSDSSVAAILNQYFVSIKVDREERPDLDRLYIAYVETVTGGAGWPLNVLLTPDRKPFFGGTYFRPDELKRILQKIADTWNKDNRSMTGIAGRAAESLAKIVASGTQPTGELRPAVLDATYEQIKSRFDAAHGGFGSSPKFPRPVALRFLLRHYARTGRKDGLDMTLATLRAMERGGIHDHLAGGFHRYATDQNWRVPHFEKMLYDQAQLAVTYVEAYQITHERFYAETARDILDFTVAEMKLAEGGFASALDADSRVVQGKEETSEGAFYVWAAEDIRRVLGERDAAVFDFAYGVEDGGNVAPSQDVQGELKGKNVLYEAHSTEETARKFGLSVEETAAKLTAGRKALLEARTRRPRPPVDDKLVTAWNGLMLSALARAGQALNDPRYTRRAEALAEI